MQDDDEPDISKISLHASGELRKEDCRLNEERLRREGITHTEHRKGVYRISQEGQVIEAILAKPKA